MSPFEHYRARLDSYRLARERGWSDHAFVTLVRDLDAAVARVDGHGFHCTPLHDPDALADALGRPRGSLWLKDDTGSVGGSHKARHLFGVLLHLAIEGRQEGDLAIASCGNAALAAAVVAKAAQRSLRVFIPSWADPDVVAELERLQARITVCERRTGEHGDPTYLRFGEAVAAGAVPFSCQGSMTPTTLDGGRTLGWELADQLRARGVSGRLRLYVQVGGGALASALWTGLLEGVRQDGVDIEAVMHPVQTESCAPLARAWQTLCAAAPGATSRMQHALADPQRFMWPWEEVGMSAASGILDDVTYDWLPIAQAMNDSGGWPVVASEDEVRRAHALVHAHTVIDADATGTSGLSGVLHDLAAGRLPPGDRVVVPVTGVTRTASGSR
jgi:threonine synthase